MTANQNDGSTGHEKIDQEVENILISARSTCRNLKNLVSDIEKMRLKLKQEFEEKKEEKRKIIKNTMKKKGISLEQLADLTNTNISEIKEMLEGKIDIDVLKIVKICMELGVSRDDLD